MLRRPPKSDFDKEIQAIHDAEYDAQQASAEEQEKEIQQEESQG
jgi:hypothetical protein